MKYKYFKYVDGFGDTNFVRLAIPKDHEEDAHIELWCIGRWNSYPAKSISELKRVTNIRKLESISEGMFVAHRTMEELVGDGNDGNTPLWQYWKSHIHIDMVKSNGRTYPINMWDILK